MHKAGLCALSFWLVTTSWKKPGMLSCLEDNAPPQHDTQKMYVTAFQDMTSNSAQGMLTHSDG